MNLLSDTFATPFGDFSLAMNSAGALVATAFGDLTALRSRLSGNCHIMYDAAACRAAREQILAFLNGDRWAFDLTLAPEGTPFQQQVWAALLQIPLGETRSYGQLAVALGRPAAARAVGRANATNPICLVIPCHRVIGADGSLTGFAFGVDLKRRLLDLERNVAARCAA